MVGGTPNRGEGYLKGWLQPPFPSSLAIMTKAMDTEMRISNSSKLEQELTISSTGDFMPLDPALQHGLEQIVFEIHEVEKNVIRQIKMGYSLSKVANGSMPLSVSVNNPQVCSFARPV